MPGTVTNNLLGLAQTSWLYQPVTWLEGFVIFNFACLTGDIVLAHGSNHFRNGAEYIPLLFSPIASAFLLRHFFCAYVSIGAVLGNTLDISLAGLPSSSVPPVSSITSTATSCMSAH